MKLDQDTVNNIAKLARLQVQDSELNRYCDDLSNILDLVEQMDSCDTSDIEPMTHPMDAHLTMREDKISEHNQRDKFQSIAPSVERGLYLVPKVID